MLQGALPIMPPGLLVLFSSNNRLSGTIDLSICNAASHTDVDLSNNKLVGQIPYYLGSSSIYLKVLNLQSNNFTGSILVNFLRCNSLMNLDFSYNRLEGVVPQSLSHCNSLEVLNLENNKLNDTFLYWLGTISKLQVLILLFNYFHGPVTIRKQLFSKLRILDLSNNRFNRTLSSKFIENLRTMRYMGEDEEEFGQYLGDNGGRIKYDFFVTITMKNSEFNVARILNTWITIDVSSNMFRGDILVSVEDLEALRWLNLSHNNFTNHIPPSIGNLKVRESLDLSCNNLSGKIPQEIGRSTFLEAFNVSQNQLVGSIPHSSQLNTFNNDSYLGNFGLCGSPLSKKCTNEDAPKQLPLKSVNPLDTEWASNIYLWEVILMGCGFGWMVGVVSRYFILSAREPLWLSRWAYQLEYRVLQRFKRRARDHQMRPTRK